MIDAVDFGWLSAWKWSYSPLGYAVRRVGKEMVYLHREVARAKPGELVDHKDGNGLDCRRSNLRIVTKSQNMMNRHAPSTNTSGYKGVSWHKGAGKWMVYISAGGKRIYLGLFEELQRAVAVWNEAAELRHGEHAKLQTYKETK